MRETRLTGIVSHILIGLSVFLIPYPMAYIPTAVLNGLFLYMAITSLNGNQMFERITLLFMEQVSDQSQYVMCQFASPTWSLLLGCIPAQPLYPEMSTTKDSSVYTVPNGSTWFDVFLWLFPLSLHKNGISNHRHTTIAIQVIPQHSANKF